MLGLWPGYLALPAAYLLHGRPSSFMFIFYVDESGSPHSHNEPLQNGQTPLFVLASLAFQAEEWRALDREYLSLKTRFFQDEIRKRRPEQHEIKGKDLIGPHNKTSRRRHAFAQLALKLCSQHHARGFALIFKKSPTEPISPTSLYTMALQYLVERFNCFLDETTRGYTLGIKRQHGYGIIVADTRLNNLDLNVAISHLSFIFGNPIGQRCTSVIEAPTFAFSQLSVGLQLTDIFAGFIYAREFFRHCHGIQGGHDYSHLSYFHGFAERLEFKSEEAYDGHRVHGYRYINLSELP
jgi:hypothetical protein